MSGLIIHRTAELPDLQIWWFDDAGALINFSSGYTFSFKLGRPGSAAVLTKTSGITGAAGSGTETSGTPNLTIAFTAAELDGLTAGRTTGQITATTGGRDRTRQFAVEVRDVVS